MALFPSIRLSTFDLFRSIGLCSAANSLIAAIPSVDTQSSPLQTNMTRSRSDEPLPARHRNAAAVIGPSLNPVLDDQTSFIDDIVQYSRQVLEALQALGRRYNRDHLGRARELAIQVERIKTDVADVRRSHFDGLRRLCTDRQPECIVLEELHTLLSELKSVWKRLLEISHDILHDQNAALQCESFEEFDHAISGKITKTREDWEDIPRHLESPLCRSAARMIEGNDTGSVRTAQTTNHQEHGILRQRHGLFQQWHCPDCPRTIKFFVKARKTSLESAALPPRVAGESFHNKVAWRDVWCAKSHLTPGLGAKYACLFCLGEGKLLGEGQMPCPTFNNAKDLVKHIADVHNSSTLPKVFMHKLHVTKASDQAGGRSDLSFLRE